MYDEFFFNSFLTLTWSNRSIPGIRRSRNDQLFFQPRNISKNRRYAVSKKFSNVPEAIQSSELEKSIRENRSIKLQVHDARESVRRMFRAKFRFSVSAPANIRSIHRLLTKAPAVTGSTNISDTC